MIDPYFIIQHWSLKQTEALVVAHDELREIIDTAPPSSSSAETIPVPTSPTVPAKGPVALPANSPATLQVKRVA